MVQRTEPKQLQTQQWASTEIAWLSRFCLGQLPDCRFGVFHITQVHLYQTHRRGFGYHLDGTPIDDRKGGAQHFMTAHYLVQRSLERVLSQLSVQSHRQGNVVKR